MACSLDSKLQVISSYCMCMSQFRSYLSCRMMSGQQGLDLACMVKKISM